MRTLFVTALCALSCGASPVSHSANVVRAAPSEFTTEAERRELFDALVRDVRAHHVFADATPKNLGRKWEDDLPELEREMLAAKTERALVVALTHFGNALHDGHCQYEPESRGKTIALGVRADFEWRGDQPFFYLARVDDAVAKTIAAPGDPIRSVDGVAVGELVTRYMNVSHQNNLRGVARDVAEFLTRRTESNATTNEGDASTWVVGDGKTLTLRWSKPTSHDEADEFAIAYDAPWCSTLPARDYGPYEVTARGMNFCIYASQVEPYKSHPILRQFSFLYIFSGRGDLGQAEYRVRVDHDVIARELARLAPKGLLVDLRDNGGGNNPNWFMDWFANGSWVDRFVATRLSADFDTKEKLEKAGVGHAADYLKELAARAPDQAFTKPRPFFCKHGDCAWDNRYTPAHRVTTAPIALLVGSRCTSSCDSIAGVFAENHFGPLVGEPTAAAFTTTRIERPVTVRGKPFGTISLAFTRDISGVTHEPVEGVPIALDMLVERTLGNRDAYDRLLVDAAIHFVDRR